LALRALIAALGLGLAREPAFAQTGNADILTGVVRDSAGKPIAEAVVEATSLESGISRSTKTDSRGRYTIVFPDGGGQYRVQVRYIGMQPRLVMVIRKADEDRLVMDVTLSTSPARLADINVRGARAPPAEGVTPGELARMLPPELLRRLPLDASDLNLIATLAPGVSAVDATDSTAAGFSVAGQRPTANAVALDGLLFSGGNLPSEGLRSVRVITNTFDVSRGQFSGGLLSTTTRSGTNSTQGSWFYGLRDRGLEVDADTAAAFGRGYTQHQLSGGMGGALVRNHLFAYISGQGRLRSDDLASLLAASPPTLERLGAEPDSVARFLRLLDAKGLDGATIRRYDSRATDDGTTLARIDWIVSSSQTLTLRGDWRKNRQDPTRISALALEQTGEIVQSEGGGGLVALTSRFGTSVVNEAKAYLSGSSRERRGLAVLPQGQVQLASVLNDGREGVTSLIFGGAARAPQNQDDHGLELSDEFSWLPGGGGHRIKLGGLLSLASTRRDATPNRFGTYTYASLADFAANQPASFTRTMAAPEVEGSSANSALWLGDTWRPSRQLQLTYGVRAEGSLLRGAPAYQPDVDQLFGRRTDRFPAETHVSPRLGFSWTAASGEGRLPRTVIRGGVGEFRSPLAVSLGSSARAASGAPGGEGQLFCVGAAVPPPDWSQFASNPGSIPSACTDTLVPAGITRAPSVTVFAPGFAAPRSVRSALGIQRRIGDLSSLSLDLSYVWGLSQSGFSDLNLATTPRFILRDEGGRPVYVAPEAIQSATGAVGLIGSRRYQSYGQVLSLDSDLRSRAFQITLGASGFSRKGMVYQASYTYSRARDQSSGDGWAVTGGNPNQREWARSEFERRHQFLLNLTYPVTRVL